MDVLTTVMVILVVVVVLAAGYFVMKPEIKR